MISADEKGCSAARAERPFAAAGASRYATSILTFLVLGLAVPAAHAQSQSLDPARAQATRPELQELLTMYERSALSPAYSAALRLHSQREAERIRERLARGDFDRGDRIQLTVEREPSLSETFAVLDGPELRLPQVRVVPMERVLRSELEEHLRAQIARFVESPQVRAQALIRLSIVGAVPRPGFYAAASESLISDALMLAGGPTPDARIDGITLEREGHIILESDQIRQAIVDGRSLDQIDARDGDRIRVRQRSRGLLAVQGAIGWVTMLTTLPFTVYSLTRLF
jgi:hypothetical protein